MRKGIGVGKLLFFSFFLVILIPVISIGYHYVDLENRVYRAEKEIMVNESRVLQRALLREHVDRTIAVIHSRMEQAALAPKSSPRSTGDLQAQMLRRIRRDRFGESGHMFVFTREGVLLADPFLREETGKNVLSFADSSGKKMFAELLRSAESDSGGYVEYFAPLPGKDGQRRKVAYVRAFPEWGWVIGSGVYAIDQEKILSVWDTGHRRAFSGQWRLTVIAVLSAVFISLIVSFLFSRLWRLEFHAFSGAFETAALSRGSIDISGQNLSEFIRLSDSVNRVLGERDQAERSEREGEQLYRAIVEDLPGMLCRFRPDGVLTFVNDEYCRYFNRTRGELLGTCYFALIPEDARASVRREFGSLTPDRPVANFERPVLSPEGETRWQRWIGHAIFEGETVREFQSYGEDITERKEAEETLRASEEKLRFITENSADILWHLDADYRFTYVGGSENRLYGYTRDQIIGSSMFDLLTPEGAEAVRRLNRDRIAREKSGVRTGVIRHELLVKCGDGRQVWAEATVNPYRDHEGKLTGYHGMLRDITGRKEAEEALRASEEKYRHLLENAQEIILVVQAGKFAFANKKTMETLGYSPEEFLARDFPEFIHPGDRERIEKRYAELMSGEGTPVRQILSVFHRNGETRVMELSSTRISWEGEPALLVFLIDVTEREKAESALRESELNYRSLIHNMENGFANHRIVVDDRGEPVDYIYTEINDAYERITGFTREQLIGRRETEVSPGTDGESFDWMGTYGRVALTGEPARFEAFSELLGKWFSVSAYSHTPGCFVTNFYDITDHKRAEAALRESEERFRSLVEEENGFPVQGYDRDRRVIFWNTASEKLYGYTRGEALGKKLEDLIIPPAIRGKVMQGMDAWVQQGVPIEPEEFDLMHKDGSAVPVFSRHVLIHNRYGEPELYCIDMSLAERRRAEAALRESEEKHRILLDESSDPIFAFERGGRYTYVNRAFAEGVGKTVEEIVGNHIYDVFDREEADKRYAVLNRVFQTGVEKVFEVRVPRPDGDRFYLTTVTPIKGREDAVLSVICSSKDITDRVHADEALLAEKERLAVTLRSIGDGVITTDRGGKVLLLNRVAEELTGWTQAEAENRALEDVFHIVNENSRERCENPVSRVLATRGVVGLANHTVLLSRDGREIVLADSGAPILDHLSRIIGVVLVFRDVTGQKRMEDELLRMEKLESIGVLAGGIAHDFNNILTGILGAISMARLYTGPGNSAHSMLQEAEHQSLRARDLTAQLLTFSKGGAPVRIAASIVETVRETVNFALRGSRVRAEFSLPGDLWTALVDLNQLSHVINNLALNSVQAMPEGGCIELDARNAVIGEDSGLPLSPGRYIHLRFRDHGVGIPRDHLSRIFDPYFTTKQMGSGLGLATSWSIIKRHDGHIRVESELGAGTVFHIYLPATGISSIPHAEETERLFLGQGRVLVMDDDDGIRKTAAMLIEALGYSVETVDDGAAAVAVYCRAIEEGEPFDAVIMDLTIPGGVGGMEAMEALRAHDPGVRAIVSSGYSTDPIMSEYSRHGFSGVLVKPYRAEDISRVLRQVTGG